MPKITLNPHELRALNEGRSVKAGSPIGGTAKITPPCNNGEHNWGHYKIRGTTKEGIQEIERSCKDCKANQTEEINIDTIFDVLLFTE